jgi:hypothetical protein
LRASSVRRLFATAVGDMRQSLAYLVELQINAL